MSLRGTWIHLKSSLWFVPAVCVLLSGAAALGLIELDLQHRRAVLQQWPAMFNLSPEGSRSILAAIAQSVITIAGVTFSITIVALSIAANQYTPRVLRNFMRDRGNQFVLGGLMGIFTYCLVVLRTIHGGDYEFVPPISVLFALVLALVAIGLFIYFIHHVAATIQADTIISSVAGQTIEVIQALLPEEATAGAVDCELTSEEEQLLGEGQWQAVACKESGYLQTVDLPELTSFAQTHGLVVKMHYAIGAFAVAGKPLVWIKGANLSKEQAGTLTRMFIVKPYRTIEQDMAFGIRQIVDIAVKALSPGVNDPTTAVTCLHYLAAIFCFLVRRHIPPRCTYQDGKLCVVVRRPNFEDLVDLSFEEIRQNSGNQPAVLLGMLAALEEVATAKFPVRQRNRSLWKHADLVLRMAEQKVIFLPDLEQIRTATAQCKSAIERATPAHEP